ncbi:MAG: hypothetical protein NT018_02365 [Armatimonadetes bacterium]|nr:hypothetical protein [Armatimonadota bacterium]
MKLYRSGMLCLLLVALFSACGAAWGRALFQDDIGTCLAQRDGSRVTLSCEEIIWPGKSGKSFAIKEFGEPQPALGHARLVVVSTRPLPVSKYWSCDLTGILSTFSGFSRNGAAISQRVLIVTPESVAIYCDSKGRPFLFPTFKGFGIEWRNKRTLAELSGASGIKTPSVLASDAGSFPSMPDYMESETTPVYCATIADAEALYVTGERNLVELQCRPFSDATATQFTLGQDDPTDSVTVYYSGSSSLLSGRIKKIVGTIQKDTSNNYWIEVDSGPNWQIGDSIGSAQSVKSGSIAWAKTFPDGTTLPTDGRAHALEAKHVAWCDGSNIYIEEADRSCGILLSSTPPPDDNPYIATIDGTIYNPTDGSEALISASTTYSSTASALRPLGMNHKSLSQELSPSGLLLRISGKVTAINSTDGYIYLDDGSRLLDGTQTDSADNVGIRVLYVDDYYPAVGDFAIINGPLAVSYDNGADTYVKCIRSNGLLDATLFPSPAPENLTAVAGNGFIDLSWQKMNAANFYIYRSSSETGTYAKIGEASGTGYRDTTVTNAVTYWYKISAVNGSTESTKAGPVSAAASTSAPIVSINSAVIDTNGLLTLQCTGSCSAGEPAYTLSVDDEVVWTFSQSEISSIVYDTSQLPNGNHNFELAANYGDYCAVASQSLNVQNFISQFNMPDDMCGLQPISANFQTSTSWTLTISQSGSTLYSTSGSGTSMEVSWDAGSTSGEFNVTLAANGRTRSVKSRKSSPPGGDYYAWSSLSIADGNSSLQQGFAYMAQYAANAWFPKYGVSIYSGMLSHDSDWKDVAIDDVLNGNIRCNNLAIAAHGIAQASDQKNPLWQGVICGHFPSSVNVSGLTAFVNVTGRIPGTWTAVGPAIGNTIDWDPATGRLSNWNSNRKLRFVYIAACKAGQGIFSLAFGTPRGRYPGKGRAFLGFKDVVYGAPLMNFCDKFWSEWSKSNITVARAATNAYWYVKKKDKRIMNYVLHGDPNLLIK